MPPSSPKRRSPAATATPEDPSAERRSSSRLGLTPERILETALALLDREGLDGLTMRRLADELDIGTMTLYGYFRTKDALLDALVDHHTRYEPQRARGTWKDRLRHLMEAVHRSHQKHPGIVELRLQRPLISAGALAVTDAAMEILLGAGFTKRQAARAYRTLFIYTFGFSAFGPGGRGRTEQRATLAAINALPSEGYPALKSSAGEAADAMADPGVFELGLTCILDGLERRLRAR